LLPKRIENYRFVTDLADLNQEGIAFLTQKLDGASVMATRILTAAEVAEILQLNVETVYSLISKDDLPAAKIGGQWRFDEDAVRAWIRLKSVNRLAVEKATCSAGDRPQTGNRNRQVRQVKQ
jgi:excisionase family DNA binding protein